MTIAITGATGQLGRLAIEKLKAGVPAAGIVALARSPAKAAGLGVAVREADYARPETLASALSGVDTLLLISSSEIGRRVVQHRNAVGAAKEAGVGRIAYTSLLHADTSPLDLAEEHRATEAELRASGIPHTILRKAGTRRTTPARSAARWPAARSSAAPVTAGSRPRRAPTTPTRRSPR